VSDPIKAALRDAAASIFALPIDAEPSEAAAAAVAAFLRALPDSDVCTQGVFNRRWIDEKPTTLHGIAAAVERAVRDVADG
jgi:hypothetical protein